MDISHVSNQNQLRIVSYLQRSACDQYYLGEYREDSENDRLTAEVVYLGEHQIHCGAGANPSNFMGRMFLFYDGNAYLLGKGTYRLEKMKDRVRMSEDFSKVMFKYNLGKFELDLSPAETERLISNLPKANVSKLSKKTIARLIDPCFCTKLEARQVNAISSDAKSSEEIDLRFYDPLRCQW
ncbi:MAG: hypothetical protein LBI81_01045 [Puniceicoccales bacterium]|jgi:hypothetical protein|nr:hypothetical protein [Puniceicoccales bacterium]